MQFCFIYFSGAWPYTDAVSKGEDFEPTCMHRANTENMLVAGDTSGFVKLHRFPCISKDTPPVKAVGHVKDISKVRFTCDGKYAISVGKVDRSVIVWKVLVEAGKGDTMLTDGEAGGDDASGGSKKLVSTKKKTVQAKAASERK